MRRAYPPGVALRTTAPDSRGSIPAKSRVPATARSVSRPGTNAASPEAGLTTGDAEEAMKRALAARAAETYILASSEKIGTASRYRVLLWEEISGLITDADPRRGHRATHRARRGNPGCLLTPTVRTPADRPRGDPGAEPPRPPSHPKKLAMARVSVARGLTGAPPQAAQFVGAPDQEGEDGDEGDHVEGQGSGAEEALQGGT